MKPISFWTVVLVVLSTFSGRLIPGMIATHYEEKNQRAVEFLRTCRDYKTRPAWIMAEVDPKHEHYSMGELVIPLKVEIR